MYGKPFDSIQSDELDAICGGCGFHPDDCACYDGDGGGTEYDNSDHYGGWADEAEYPF